MEKEQTEISPFAVHAVLAALKEVQDTVRAYDTKAQIVGVGFIFSIGIITGFGEPTTQPTRGGLRQTLVFPTAHTASVHPHRLLQPLQHPASLDFAKDNSTVSWRSVR